jgi:hypothetical protein
VLRLLVIANIVPSSPTTVFFGTGDISLLRMAHTGSGTNPGSSTLLLWKAVLGGEAVGGIMLTSNLHLVLCLRMRIYTSTDISLRAW